MSYIKVMSIASKFRASKDASYSQFSTKANKGFARPCQAINPSVQHHNHQQLVEILLRKQQTENIIPQIRFYPPSPGVRLNYLPVSSKQTSVWPSVWP